MAVPYVFGSTMGGSDIPLSELDDNFSYLTGSPTFDGNVTVNGNLYIFGGEWTENSNYEMFNIITRTGAGVNGNYIQNFTWRAYNSSLGLKDYARLIVRQQIATPGSETGSFEIVGSKNGLLYQAIAIEGVSDALYFGNSSGETARITSAGNLGLGTTTPAGRVHAYSATDDQAIIAETQGATGKYGLLRAVAGTQKVDVIVYKNGSSFFYTSNANMAIGTDTNDFVTVNTNNTERARFDQTGNVICNTAAIATTATDGFLYVAGCAGTPTGVPTTYTGRVPIVVDTTNNRLYFYSGGSWRNAGP